LHLHLDCGHFDAFCDHILENHRFALNSRRTVLYGRCKDCLPVGLEM
jgi:Fe2+ or Zn2+ uptake regulation protein